MLQPAKRRRDTTASGRSTVKHMNIENSYGPEDETEEEDTNEDNGRERTPASDEEEEGTERTPAIA